MSIIFKTPMFCIQIIGVLKSNHICFEKGCLLQWTQIQKTHTGKQQTLLKIHRTDAVWSLYIITESEIGILTGLLTYTELLSFMTGWSVVFFSLKMSEYPKITAKKDNINAFIFYYNFNIIYKYDVLKTQNAALYYKIDTLSLYFFRCSSSFILDFWR